MANDSVDFCARIEELKYLYASNVNVSNFVSVKLSNDRNNYHVWKSQMLCLMESQNMLGIVDPNSEGPTEEQIRKQHDSLLRGWILGSLSEDVLPKVVDLTSVKDVWGKLKSIYDPEITSPIEQQARVATETVAVTGTGNNDRNRKLREAVVEGNWLKAAVILKKDNDAVRDAISSDGNTMLHLAVGIGRNNFVKKLLNFIQDGTDTEIKNSDGRTALHIAAIVGNKYSAQLLVKKRKELLKIEDKKKYVPLLSAFCSMQLNTFEYLCYATMSTDYVHCRYPHTTTTTTTTTMPQYYLRPYAYTTTTTTTTTTTMPPFYSYDAVSRNYSDIIVKSSDICVNLLINAIIKKQYDLAFSLVDDFPELIGNGNQILMAMAINFPSELEVQEKLICPSLSKVREKIVETSYSLSYSFEFLYISAKDILWALRRFNCSDDDKLFPEVVTMLLAPVAAVAYPFYHMICLVILVLLSPFVVLYFLLWKLLATVGPIKRIEKKKNDYKNAKRFLNLIGDRTKKFAKNDYSFYSRPIIEAASQGAYEVVDEILHRAPEAINCKNQNGHDIIQLAVINRSEKIYNLVHHIVERKDFYRTVMDSSKNNMLHLAARLAPPRILSRTTGAVLQLQRELQWYKEVQKLVFPVYVLTENIFHETPEMVFTREHQNLVKEGEKWMKTAAESCSITAALIITTVFAGAITVPGGSNQETGIPLFKGKTAFTVFAIADAFSLFASATALIVFSSILTARFSEKDFLVSLPRRLIIGLCTLFLSTTTMMIAFSATLYIVFVDHKAWMAPISVLTCLPIAAFVALQLPLVVDLFRSTYFPIFGKQSYIDRGKFNPNDLQSFFGNCGIEPAMENELQRSLEEEDAKCQIM